MKPLLDSTHPLALWLQKHDEAVTEFAERSEISFSALYSLMGGRTRVPAAWMLVKIQTATGGEVTIAEMLRWLEPHPPQPVAVEAQMEPALPSEQRQPSSEVSSCGVPASLLLTEETSARQMLRIQREQRRCARDLARQRSAEALAALLHEQAPPEFTEEQADAYAAELLRLYLRIAPRAHARAQRVGESH